jgi:hypothetical protein
MRIVFYFFRKYPSACVRQKLKIFQALSEGLQEYTSVEIREKGCGIIFLEEKLYLFELLLDHLEFTAAKDFVTSLKAIHNYSTTGEQVAPFGLQDNEMASF